VNCCSPARNKIYSNNILDSSKKNQKIHLKGMIRIPRGTWEIGSEDEDIYIEDSEGPIRTLNHKKFLIDEACISNIEFDKFISDTGYVTEAEIIGWSFVFYAQVHPNAADNSRTLGLGAPPWWLAVDGASWRAPDGPGSDWNNLTDHPAVHISWNDAMSYCNWSGKRLPSELEWEIAARGGLVQARYPWGDELTPNGEHQCNIWQGDFPKINTKEDGFLSTAPVKSFKSNGYGLYNMTGNVWEWCGGKWTVEDELKKPMRGGAYLCHRSYCNRYRVSARTNNTPDASSSHLGFRCAAD
jgi:sulfatase modifying factor 1